MGKDISFSWISQLFPLVFLLPVFRTRLKKKFAGWIENANKYGIHIDN